MSTVSKEAALETLRLFRSKKKVPIVDRVAELLDDLLYDAESYLNEDTLRVIAHELVSTISKDPYA